MSTKLLPPETDLHIHTVASGHAFSTINEIALAAANRGLLAVGMTDHGPSLPGGPHAYHFASLRFIPQEIHGVRILKGVEANILAAGKLDLEARYLERLELVIAGFHDGCGFRSGNIKHNTRVLCAAMDMPKIKIISHPGNPRFPVDHEVIVKHAANSGTAIEVNNSSFSISRGGDSSNIESIVHLCTKHPALLAINSDAHISQQVGEIEYARRLVEEAGIPADRIINRTLESTLAFLDLEA
ncbi:MAG: phosphatase [Desulfuromonas sp.]|nr:MAG: phosphatase [Desulfuromonas sp.]